MQGFQFNKFFENFPYIRKHFTGVFSIDTLPKSIKYRHFCICNTDISTGEGQHWFTLIRTSKNEVECFDSLGINTDKKELLITNCKFRNIKEVKFNETIFQNSETDTCGLFVIYFIIERMHNLDLTFEEILEDIFEDDTIKNEEIVSQFCDNLLIK
jgi:hypothetical protein